MRSCLTGLDRFRYARVGLTDPRSGITRFMNSYDIVDSY